MGIALGNRGENAAEQMRRRGYGPKPKMLRPNIVPEPPINAPNTTAGGVTAFPPRQPMVPVNPLPSNSPVPIKPKPFPYRSPDTMSAVAAGGTPLAPGRGKGRKGLRW